MSLDLVMMPAYTLSVETRDDLKLRRDEMNATEMTINQIQQRLKVLPDARFASPANAAEVAALVAELERRRGNAAEVAALVAELERRRGNSN